MFYNIRAISLRPQNFDEVIGQDDLVSTLSYLLDRQKRHPAILLSGIRGIGKTSLARIISKALNCEKGVSSSPCLICKQCVLIKDGEHVDVIEIDAASKTKVEEIKEWLEVLPYAPVIGRYKIMILDEAHMLSKHSFNALLKILEEPPKHVQFIFATTEASKLPVTIRSRLLRLELKPVSTDVLSNYLSKILTNEGIEHNELFCKKIASSSEGSIRDALNRMEQLLAQAKGSVKDFDDCLNEKLDEDFSIRLWNFIEKKQFEPLFFEINERITNNDTADKILHDWIGIVNTAYLINSFLKLNVKLPNFTAAPFKDNNLSRTLSLPLKTLWLLYQSLLVMRKDLFLSYNPASAIQMYSIRITQFFDIDIDIFNNSTEKQQKIENTNCKKFTTTINDNKIIDSSVSNKLIGTAKVLFLNSNIYVSSEDDEYIYVNVKINEKFSIYKTKNSQYMIEDTLCKYFNKKTKVSFEILQNDINISTLQNTIEKAKADKHTKIVDGILNSKHHINNLCNGFKVDFKEVVYN